MSSVFLVLFWLCTKPPLCYLIDFLDRMTGGEPQ